jgi:HK97 family phage prohead protease
MQHFYSPFEFKMDGPGEDDGTIKGYGSTFGNVDSFGDTVAKGAFTKTIASTMAGNTPWPVMLSQHDQTTPIGIWTGMSEDGRGLKLKGKLALNTAKGAEAYALLKMKPRAAWDGLSIGYRARDFELHKSGPVKRTLKSVDLVECSLVTFPADKFARVASVKSWLETPVVDEVALAKAWALAGFERLRRLTNHVPR